MHTMAYASEKKTAKLECIEALLFRLNSCHLTIHFTWTISMNSVEFLDIRKQI